MNPEQNFSIEAAQTAFEVFLPKVQEVASGTVDTIDTQKLDDLIEECTKIELIRQNQQIFNTLIDLRRALFREDKPKESAEVLFEKLKSLV